VLFTIWAGVFALLFLLPTVLTITNSFMSSTEITANYGAIFATGESGGKAYISERVNLKFIPDMVTFKQYITVLFKSPDYLFKFWNSVILVLPIVLLQVLVAALAAYGFARYRGRGRELLFFLYIILMLVSLILAARVAISYSQIYYIYLDDPYLSPKEVMLKSKLLMEGNYGRYLYLLFSFTGVMLLGILSFTIGFIWLTPYMSMTQAEFYRDLIGETQN